jgi:L-lactate dehydrogenase
LSKKIFVSPKDIHAYILGEHGDNSFPVYEYAEVGGQRLLDFPGINSEIVNEAYLAARNSAAEIISKKGATYYAIGVVVMKIVEAILNDSKVIYPLSVPLMDYYGYSNVCLSVPCVLGKNGVERVLKIKLSEIEKNNLATAVEVLKNRLK